MACSTSVFLCYVFFFKQKTAYEWRISDWSSDVCSSDLPSCRSRRSGLPADRRHCARSPDRRPHRRRASPPLRFPRPPSPRPSAPVARTSKTVPPCRRRARRAALLPFQGSSFLLLSEVCADAEFPRPRSEEHTSELQSLMRISYAVFFFNQKNDSLH